MIDTGQGVLASAALILTIMFLVCLLDLSALGGAVQNQWSQYQR